MGLFSPSYSNGNLTWLQRQQQKLKERRELRLREERQPHETRLLCELKQVQTRHMRPTASHRLGKTPFGRFKPSCVNQNQF